MRKELGKIRRASFGYGGYQDAMIGVSLDIGGKGWGVSDFFGTWGHDPDGACKWDRGDQDAIWGDTLRRLRGVLDEAGAKSVEDLVGVPVEVTFDGNKLQSWRVLKEVL